MQKRRKKSLIIIAVIIACTLVFGVVFSFVSKLDSVCVTIRQRLPVGETNFNNATIDKVKYDGNFKYGKSLLFYNFDDSIAEIEKKNPYVKVEQVIRKFPNMLNVYISEREPVCYVKGDENYFIFDKEFKLLEKFSIDDQSRFNDKFALKTYQIDEFENIIDLEKGYFAEFENKVCQCEIYTGVVGSLESTLSIKSVLFLEDGVEIILRKAISNDDGTVIKLCGKSDLEIQVFAALEYYNEITDTKDINYIEIEKTQAGKYTVKNS